MLANFFRTLNLTAIFSTASLVLSEHACAEWTRLEEDQKGTTVYVDRITLDRENDNSSRLWSLVDFASPQVVAGKTYRSSKIQHQYDCMGERARIMHMSLHSGNMGLGNAVITDSTLKKWSSVSPDSIGSAAYEYACSIFSIDGSKHKYSQDEIPGWKQGPSTDDADVFFDPKSVNRTKDKVSMLVIANFKIPIVVESNRIWSAKVETEFDCTKQSSRYSALTYFDLPYGKGARVSDKKKLPNAWKPVSANGLSMGMWKIACGSL